MCQVQSALIFVYFCCYYIIQLFSITDYKTDVMCIVQSRNDTVTENGMDYTLNIMHLILIRYIDLGNINTCMIFSLFLLNSKLIIKFKINMNALCDQNTAIVLCLC